MCYLAIFTFITYYLPNPFNLLTHPLRQGSLSINSPMLFKKKKKKCQNNIALTLHVCPELIDARIKA